MEFGFVALEMLTISLPIVLGYIARKLDFMDDTFDAHLSKLILNISMPCMVLASLGSAGGLPKASDILWMVCACTLMLLVAGIAALIITKLLHVPKKSEGSYQFMVMFGNVGYIGLPVIQALLGKQALLLGAIGLIPFNILNFSVGILMFTGSSAGVRGFVKSILTCLKSPVLIACFIVSICIALGIEGFGQLSEALEIVGNLTTPAALLLTGSSIAAYNFRSMFVNPRAYVAAGGRLLIAPLAGFLLLKMLPLPFDVLQAALLQASMPIATNGLLYCLDYGVDTKPMIQGTFISIAASIVTIPLVLVLSSSGI